MIFLLNGAIQASVILIVALLTASFLHGSSAAVRHCVLSAGILFAAVVPGLSLLMPSWNYVLPIHSPAPLQQENVPPPQETPAGNLKIARPLSSNPAASPEIPRSTMPASVMPAIKVRPDASASARKWFPSRSISDVASWIWVAGLLLTFASLLAGIARLGWIAFHARVADSEDWRKLAQEISSHYGLARTPRLLISSSSLLVTWGWRTPRILLPPGSEDWPAERIRAVLCHELAHVRRGGLDRTDDG